MFSNSQKIGQLWTRMPYTPLDNTSADTADDASETNGLLPGTPLYIASNKASNTAQKIHLPVLYSVCAALAGAIGFFLFRAQRGPADPSIGLWCKFRIPPAWRRN